MTKLSKLSLAALGGVTVLMLAVPADAAIGRSKFRASVDEIRRYCERLDESFWKKRHWYGCGDKLGCRDGSCVIVKKLPPPPPPTYQPPRFYSLGGKGGQKDGGGDPGTKAGGNNDGGNDNGGGNQGSSSAAGGPN